MKAPPDDSKPNPCPRGTINHHDEDVQQVAAALGDACLARGLDRPYYLKADEALARLAGKIDERNRVIVDLRDEVERLKMNLGDTIKENLSLQRERDAAVCQELDRLAPEDPTAEQRGQLSSVAITQIRRLLKIPSGTSTVSGVRDYMTTAETNAAEVLAVALNLDRCSCKGSDPKCDRCDGLGFVAHK